MIMVLWLYEITDILFLGMDIEAYMEWNGMMFTIHFKMSDYKQTKKSDKYDKTRIAECWHYCLIWVIGVWEILLLSISESLYY